MWRDIQKSIDIIIIQINWWGIPNLSPVVEEAAGIHVLFR